MKILIDYQESDLSTKEIKIIEAKYLSDFIIEVEFSDGLCKSIDFKPFLSKSLHPSITKYLDEDRFSNFKLIDGNLNWNNYDLIFPVWDLYHNKLEV